MANGQFVNPISAGVESFQRQAGQFFRSQAEVNIFQQERERQEKEAERKTALDILKAAEAIKDPEQRVGFLRRAAALTGVTIPPEIDSELASLATNDQFMKSMKRLPDLILGIGKERAFEEFAGGLPAPTPGLPEEAGALAQAQQGALAGVAPGFQPSAESQLLAGQVGSFVRRGEALPEELRKATQRFVQPAPSPGRQLAQLREAVPTPEGGREEVTTVLEEGRPKITRKVTEGEEKPPSTVGQLAWLAAGPEGPTTERAKKALETWKTKLSERQGHATTSTFIEWAVSDDATTRKRGEKAIAIWKGLNENAVVMARTRAFDRATKTMAANPRWAGVPENDPARKLEFRRLYRSILEEFFLPSGEGAGGADLSSLSDEELAERALDQDDEAAMEELLRRQGGQ